MAKLLMIALNLKDLVRYAGGTAGRYSKEGYEVYAVAVCEKETERSAETVSALGLKSCEYLDLSLPLDVNSVLSDRLASVIRRIRPDRIITYSKYDDPSHPSHSSVRDYAMTAYQTASGAGYRDGQAVSPRQTPFFGFVCGNEKPDFYLSIDSGIDSKKKAAINEGINEGEILADAVLSAAVSDHAGSVSCQYAERFTAFGASAKTGRFVW